MTSANRNDDRFQLIGRCVDCGDENMLHEAAGITCQQCGRVYLTDQTGIIHAMPSSARPLPKGIYESPEYLAWLKVWKQESQNWVIYSNPLYRFFSMSGHRKIVARLRDHVVPENVVVDLGCGTGKLFDLVSARRGIGIDANIDSLAEMRRRCPGVIAVYGDVLNLPFRSASLDCAVSAHTLEHLYFLGEALEEIRRCLHGQSKFLFTIPTEGGIAWELGRRFVTGRHLRQRYNLSVKKVMDVEHINDARRVLKMIDFYFGREETSYFPLPVLPSVHVNASITAVATPWRQECDSSATVPDQRASKRSAA